MRAKTERLLVVVGIVATASATAEAADLGVPLGPGTDRIAVERGRVALTLTGFLKPEWSETAYRNAGRRWDQPAPDPDRDPAGYAAAFRHRYGLHPAPYPNDGLPMGLRRGL